MNYFKSRFLKGLIVLIPFLITAYFLCWTIIWFEETAKLIFSSIFGEDNYYPGIGIIFLIVITFLLGSLTSNYLGSKMLEKLNVLLDKVPLVRLIYSSTRDLISHFDTNSKKDLGTPVLISVDAFKMSIIGFITESDHEALAALSDSFDDEKLVSVYIPMSYQVGGFTALIPQSKLSSLNLPPQEAMKYVLTSGFGVELNKYSDDLAENI